MKRDEQWSDLNAAVGYGKHDLTEQAAELHPTDEVEYYRDIAKFATGMADAQAEVNDRVGVPE